MTRLDKRKMQPQRKLQQKTKKKQKNKKKTERSKTKQKQFSFSYSYQMHDGRDGIRRRVSFEREHFFLVYQVPSGGTIMHKNKSTKHSMR